jgi:hypothetical protein
MKIDVGLWEMMHRDTTEKLKTFPEPGGCLMLLPLGLIVLLGNWLIEWLVLELSAESH